MLVGNGIQYIPASFDDEAEIERVVQDQAELLFGSGSMYLSKVRISTAQGRGTIPDGYVIDLERGCWYFVEAERAAHGTWEHIAPQVARQLAALRQREARQAVLQLALKEIETSERLRRLLPELGLKELTVHGTIASILETPPVVAIPIDEVPQDLIDWATSLKNEVKIWKIDKYVREDTGETLYGIPDDTLPTLQTAPGKANLGTTKSQGGNWFQRVLKAGC